MSDFDVKRILNRIHIKPSTHQWLIRKANSMGQPIGSYAGLRLDEIADDDMAENLDGTDVYDYYYFQKRATARARLRRAVAMHLQDPTDEGVEKLKRMCGNAGVDYEEIVATVANDPFSSVIARSHVTTQKAQCIEWLPQFIEEHGGCVYSTVVEAAGIAQGFSRSTLDRAKEAINSDPTAPTINAIKTGVKWMWEIAE